MSEPTSEAPQHRPFPTHRGERRATREMWADHIRATAEIEAKLYGLSLMCRASNHEPVGCRSNGTSCLCACHDPTPGGGA